MVDFLSRRTRLSLCRGEVWKDCVLDSHFNYVVDFVEAWEVIGGNQNHITGLVRIVGVEINFYRLVEAFPTGGLKLARVHRVSTPQASAGDSFI